MATQIYHLDGKAYYAKMNRPDEYNNAKRWMMSFAPNDMEEYKATGLQLKVRDETDMIPFKHIVLRRPCEKMINSEVVIFTPAVIEAADGSTIRHAVGESGSRVYSYNKGSRTDVVVHGDAPIIGNGSDVRVKIAVYDTVQGKGHRLESVRILNLVEYENNTESQEQEKKTEPTTSTSSKKKATPESDKDIPWNI